MNKSKFRKKSYSDKEKKEWTYYVSYAIETEVPISSCMCILLAYEFVCKCNARNNFIPPSWNPVYYFVTFIIILFIILYIYYFVDYTNNFKLLYFSTVQLQIN